MRGTPRSEGRKERLARRDVALDARKVGPGASVGVGRFGPTWLVVALIDFRSENRDLLWRLYSDLNGITVDPGDFNMNIVTDDDALVDLSR